MKSSNIEQKFSGKHYEFSNPEKAQKNTIKYLGVNYLLMPSTRKDKKYMIFDDKLKKWVHFGQFPYKDYLKTGNDEKRALYLARSTKIKGEWKKNKLSPNNLSINILWS